MVPPLLSNYFSKAAIDLIASPLTSQFRIRQITQCCFQIRMSQPHLDCPCRDSVRMMECRKGFPEAMEYPMLTARRILTGNILAIEGAGAVSAIKSGTQRPFLQNSKEVTLRVAVPVGKN